MVTMACVLFWFTGDYFSCPAILVGTTAFVASLYGSCRFERGGLPIASALADPLVPERFLGQ